MRQTSRTIEEIPVEEVLNWLADFIQTKLEGMRCPCGFGTLSAVPGRKKRIDVRGRSLFSRVVKRIYVKQDYYCVGTRNKKAISIKLDIKIYKH